MMETLRKIIGKNMKGDVGLELEVEFQNNEVIIPNEMLKGWRVERDGSLRGSSAEFISATPVSLANLPKHLELVCGEINKSNPRLNSPRTSVHVHVNCLHLTPLQILNGLVQAWLLEESLLDLCGKKRRGNRFCLSIRSAPLLIKTIQKIILGKDYSFGVNRDQYKYSNIAFHNLQTIGTIEFRGMEGTYDTNRLCDWATLCHSVIHSAAKFKNPKDMCDTLIDTENNDFSALVKNVGVPLKYSAPEIENNFFMLYALIYGTEWEHYEKANQDIGALHFDDMVDEVRGNVPRAVRMQRP